MSVFVEVITNEFEAKAFESLLPDIFNIDTIRELYRPLNQVYFISDKVLSLTYFLHSLDSKYNPINSDDYDKVYNNVSRQLSGLLFDFFIHIDPKDQDMFVIWGRVLSILRKDNKLLDSIIHSEIEPTSDFLFLLDKLDLITSRSEIISRRIELGIMISNRHSIMKFDECSSDLQEAIVEETKRQFFDTRDNYFFTLRS